MRLNRSSRFKRSFKKLPANIKEDIASKLRIFSRDPFERSLHTHKLSGKLADYYAFCLRDGYRVLFDFEKDGVVLLINIGSHDDYKKWERTVI